MSHSALVSVVVPALNESKTLEEVFDRVKKVMDALKRPFEFIVVDDGSTDNSLELLRDMYRQNPDEIVVISHYRSHGKSMALMQAFDMARGEIAVTLDADLQDMPEDIPLFLKKIEQGYDMVNGWRVDRKDSYVKRFVSRIYNLITNRLLECNLHDINCGFKAMRRIVYKRLELRGDLHRLIPAISKSYGCRVAEIPIQHKDRKFGKSRYKLLRHRGLLDIVALVSTTTTQHRPFHIFCEMAFFFWMVCIILFGVWGAINLAVPSPSPVLSIVLALIFSVGVWSGLVGTILPLFGLNLEINTRPHQNVSWRKAHVKELIHLQSETRIKDH